MTDAPEFRGRIYKDITETVGATPLVVQAYWAAGGSEWFTDAQRSQALADGESKVRRSTSNPDMSGNRRSSTTPSRSSAIS